MYIVELIAIQCVLSIVLQFTLWLGSSGSYEATCEQYVLPYVEADGDCFGVLGTWLTLTDTRHTLPTAPVYGTIGEQLQLLRIMRIILPYVEADGDGSGVVYMVTND